MEGRGKESMPKPVTVESLCVTTSLLESERERKKVVSPMSKHNKYCK